MPPTAITRQATTPVASHWPIMGCPMCAVRASWWIGSGRLSGGATQVEQVGGHDDERGDLGSQRRPPEAADREAHADDRGGVEAERGAADHRVTGGEAAGGRAEPDPGREQDGHHRGRDERRGTTGDDPPGPRHAAWPGASRDGRPSRPTPTLTRTWPPRSRPRCTAAPRRAAATRRPTRGRCSGKSIAKVSTELGELPIWSASAPASDA